MSLLNLLFKEKQTNPIDPCKIIKTKINTLINAEGRLDKKAVAEIVAEIEDANLVFPFPESLISHMKQYGAKFNLKKALEIYIGHEKKIRSGTDKKELQKAKKLGAKQVIIRTCEDGRVCSECKKHANKKYDIDKAPTIPICWECRCYYEPFIK